MSTLLVTVLALALPLAFGYDEIFDKMDVDKIIGDDDLFNSYAACLLDRGSCNAEHSAEFRKIINEVVAEACAKCTPIQKKNVKKTVEALQKKPELYEEFRSKYDPKGEHMEAFTAFMAATE